MNAPEFPRQATWLNVDAPPTLADLRGQVVLLDFWTYCCINCLHIIPTLDRIETELAGEPFVVIGVHAAKFDQEKDPGNIARAIERHGIRHPVLADGDHDCWSEYAVRAWPTLVLVNSEGKIVEQMSGEPDPGELMRKVRATIEKDRANGTLAAAPLHELASSAPDTGLLHYPGKVKVLPRAGRDSTDRMIVSDTGHHRLHLVNLTFDGDGWPRAEELTTIGTGGVGWQDGSFATATFRRPQGVARTSRALYVGDTENHLLREIDLEAGTVSTVAGTGEPRMAQIADDPRQTSLRSPWDLATVNDDAVLIAMAGYHQLWFFDASRPSVFPAVGTGREDHIDGPFHESALAQPSSVFVVGTNAVFADSEVSSIRMANFSERKVSTLVGRGLFDFGDVDGPVDQARLQHPLGAVYHDRSVYVADTFNNKIKRIDFSDQSCSTFLGDGSAEILYEPGGLEIHEGLLYIPDTNNHRIRVASLATKEIRTLELPEG